MAIEDEIINISDIDIGTEILNSDKLLIETSNGTKMIAFKDFVVGPDNISSVRQTQIEGNVDAVFFGFPAICRSTEERDSLVKYLEEKEIDYKKYLR